MSNALRRALRTFVQTFVGTVITSGLLSATAQSGVVDWSSLKKVGISALAAGIVAVLSWAQNFLEDNTSMPAVLKDQKGESQIALVCLIVLAVIAVLFAFGVVPTK